MIYTSLERAGALAETHFHLTRQPVFPSKLISVLHRIAVTTKRTLKLVDMVALERLGVNSAKYSDLDYQKTQAIGDAAAFLGFDGIIAPSARWDCLNLVLFMERFGPGALTVEASEAVDWLEWRRQAVNPPTP